MNWKTIHHDPKIRRAILALGGIIILLVVFKLGELYGYHRAGFTKRFGDNFHRNFVDPNGSRGFFGEGIPSSHGAVGKVVSVAGTKITVAGTDNLEKIIDTDTNTLIRKFRDSGSFADIKTGDYIVVIGDPNANGEIQARLIRIVPTPPSSDTNK